MCNELTTLMQVMEEPRTVPEADMLAYMEVMARTVDSHKRAIQALHARLQFVEAELNGDKDKTNDKA